MKIEGLACRGSSGRRGSWRSRSVRLGLAWVLAVTAMAVGVAPSGAQSRGPVVSPSMQVSGDVTPGRAYSHPKVLVHPDDPDTLVVASVNFTKAECGVHVSRDGGLTWSPASAAPVPPGGGICTRPAFGSILDAAFGPDGTLYFMSSLGDSAGRGPTDAYLARSEDLGATWEFTTIAASRSRAFTAADGSEIVDDERYNYPHLAVHPTNPDLVYAGFRVEAADTPASRAPTRSVVAVSTDGGRTFGPMVDTLADTFTRDELIGSDTPALAVASDGTLYAFTKERPRGGGPRLPSNPTLLKPPGPGSQCLAASANPDQPPPAEFPTPSELDGGRLPAANEPGAGARLLMSKSVDSGATWESKVIDDGGVVCIPCLTTPEAAVDPSTGAVYVVFELSESSLPFPRDNRDIFVMRSGDEGETWSPRERLNDDPTEGRSAENPAYDQMFPGISIAPNGRIDVAWHDFRTDGLYNQAGNGRTTRRDQTCWDVFYTYSTDGGATWAENLRISDRSMNQNEGYAMNLCCDLRGPIGVASTDERAVVAWPDSRNGSFDLPTEDAYVAMVVFDRPASGSDTTVKASSVFLGSGIGLALAGAVLGLYSLTRRRGE